MLARFDLGRVINARGRRILGVSHVHISRDLLQYIRAHGMRNSN